jgi:hypothetical protein
MQFYEIVHKWHGSRITCDKPDREFYIPKQGNEDVEDSAILQLNITNSRKDITYLLHGAESFLRS